MWMSYECGDNAMVESLLLSMLFLQILSVSPSLVDDVFPSLVNDVIPSFVRYVVLCHSYLYV